MPQPSSHPESNRNLLFGILAVQLNFISRDDLVSGMNGWVLDKSKSLGQIMVDQGRLSAEQLQTLESLIEQHLKVHGNDPERSLRALNAKTTAASLLTPISDDDVQTSVARLGAEPDTVSFQSASAAGAGELRYRRLRPHASGGLGDVYVAEDTELHREVALKEIKPKYADDRLCRSRFVREAEITGGLEHPGVVPVYGLGAYTDGRLYYAMRFIRGDSMRTAIEEFHAADKPGRDASERSLAFRQLLRRFVDVCNAIAYAHSRGVLHRDLKPANVMLGKFGETLVVDWGLAKAGIESGLPAESLSAEPALQPSSAGDVQATRAGALVGTTAYMSPEQAAGRLDMLGPASDIYGLGATLYVLLAGRGAFRGKGDSDTLARIQKGQFAPPRAVKPDTPAALDAICRKAMALEPKQRYATALDLAADVEHWLADEPVAAYPEPWTVRAGRMARQHRAKFVAAAVLLASAVVALSASTALVWAEQKKTAQQKEVAEQNYQLSRAQSFNIIDLIETAEPEIAAVPALHKPRKDILVLASKACRRYLEQEPDDVELRRRSAQVYRYTANVHRLTNEIEAADPLYKDSVRLYTGLANQFPDEPLHRQKISETLRDQAKLQSNLGRLQEATENLRRSIEIAEKLVNDDRHQPHLQRALAAALLSLAGVEYSRGAYDQAGTTAARAAELFRALTALAAGQGSHGYDPVLLAAALNIQAIAARESGRLDAALEMHKEPVKMLFDLTVKPPSGVNRDDVAHFFCACQLERSRTWMDKAEAKWRQSAEKGFVSSIETWEALAKKFPQVPMYREFLGFAYQLRGQLRAEPKRDKEPPEDFEKRRAQARNDFALSQKLLEQRVQESPEMPGPRGDLGKTYLQQGRLARADHDQATAAACFTKAAETLAKAREQSPDSASIARSLAEVQKELGK
jgi:eukaryotic-like serine/threonine-protein kinase